MKKQELLHRMEDGAITRRQVNRLLAAAGVALVAMPVTRRTAEAAGDQATFFTWAGYDAPDFFAPYVKKHGKPNTPVFADEQEAFQKLQAGFVADVAHPCSGRLVRWRDAGLIQPMDTSKLSNFGDLYPVLTKINTADLDGKQWFAPIDWGNTGVLYRTDKVEPKEDSYSLLWDERYKGSISMGEDITDTAIIGGLYVGVKDPYAMNDSDIEKVKQALLKQKPLLRFYWSDTTVLEQAIASGEVVVSTAWNGTLAKMLDQGIPARFMKPKEGMLTWCCGAVLTKNAPHPDLAHDMIDALISKEAGVWMINYGYGHSNRKAIAEAGAKKVERLGLPADPEEFLKTGVFSRDNKRLADLQKMFESVKAGI
jgi:spermidine/putrescine transport system substrate-binding protein